MSIAQSQKTATWGRRIAPLFLGALLTATTLGSSELLWNPEVSGGQWKAFGAGVLDHRSLVNPPGLSMQVDWNLATFGVGASYQAAENGGAFPVIPSRGRLRAEMRIISENADEVLSKVRSEWVERSSGGGEQVVAVALSHREAGEGGWVLCEFEFSEETPRFVTLRPRINALRIVIPKQGQEGQGRVEIRQVELHAD